MSSDLAFNIAMMAGWLALTVWMVWPEQKHCTCCSKNIAKAKERRHK